MMRRLQHTKVVFVSPFSSSSLALALARGPRPLRGAVAASVRVRHLSSSSTSDASDAAARAERIARMKQTGAAKPPQPSAGAKNTISAGAGAAGAATKVRPSSSSTSSLLPLLFVLGGAAAVIGYSVYDIKRNPDGTLGKIYLGSALDNFFSDIFGSIESVYQPSSEKLLLNYESGSFYGQVPPGSPAPPLLVLDLERTLIGSDYDAKFGWRHVKRPGLQRFIDRMSQYYEIVILSENELNPDLLQAIDPDGKCHKYGPSAMELRNGQMLKRLDLMNRDLARIVLIDDSEEAAQLFPRNTLYVKPFEDIHDSRDNALEELMLLLQALVHDGVDDVRDTLDDLGTHEAAEAVIEYKMRVAAVKEKERRKRDRGLGGVLKAVSGVAVKSSDDYDDDSLGSRSIISKIVGASPEGAVSGAGTGTGVGPVGDHLKDVKGLKLPDAPGKTKKKGALFAYLEEAEAEKARMEELKMQRWQEIQMRRMKERADKDELERKKREEL